MAKKTSPTYAAPAIDRMLDIVEFLAQQHQPFGVTELSRTLDISTNSVFRIMRRLTERGYAIVDPESGGYQLGPKFFSLGMRLASQFDLRKQAREPLQWLAHKTGETCQIHTPDGDRVLVLDVITPDADFFFQVAVGARTYWHSDAFGKTILAFRSEEEIRETVSGNLVELTCNTITDMDAFLENLKKVRQTGIAYDWEEYNVGVYCIGAPVFDVTGQAVAGVGMTGLEARFRTDAREQTEKLVLTAAKSISQNIGYTGNIYDKWIS